MAEPSATAEGTPESPGVARRVLDRLQGFVDQFSFIGLLVAGAFLCLSVTPSLLPRSGLLQGVLGGITASVGYALGTAASATWRYLELPEPSERARRRLRWAGAAVVGVSLAWFLSQAASWQNRLREVFGMDSVHDASYPFLVLVVAVATFVVVVGIARLVVRLVRWLIRQAERWLPVRLARALGVALGALIVWSLVTDVLIDSTVRALQGGFSVQNGSLDPDLDPPSSTLRSGGPESLIGWESLGRPGRRFVTGAPTTEELDAFSGGGAIEPVRVYVGRDSADSPQARADLLLEEMERAGAFDRSVLVLATSTGSGGLDPWGMQSVEYLHNGDTAIAGVQYSFLPSWLSFYVDQEAAKEAASVTFDTVYDHWTTLDPETRPELYLFGVSLGSFGSEASSNSLRTINDPIDGAVWAGPTFLNESWQSLVRDRDPGSPAYAPIFQDGTVVRFTGRQDLLDEPTGTWGDARYVYIQHPSDPVSFFSPSLLLHEPNWLAEGRPPDFSPDMHWYPFVTFWQVALDLPAGGSVPPGFGHNFSIDAYVHAWAAVTEPDGWSDGQTEDLIGLLSEERGA